MLPILIVEDDADLREALEDTLDLAGLAYISAADGQEAVVLMNQQPVSLVVSDVSMPKMTGEELLSVVKSKWPATPVVLMTAYGTIDQAVDAMRNGVADYLVKPFEPKTLLNVIKPLLAVQKASSTTSSHQPLVADPASLEVLQLAKKVAATQASVMIGGSSGTGKEVLARYIHAESDRVDQAFVALNCAAIPENLLEATLFGYERGAFTGATASTPGKFEQADGGTILLDEVTEMPLDLQAKLLRVLQEQEVERLGGRKTLKLDVRVLATSNRDLKQAVAEGVFREDLYYRLNVFPLAWPNLAQRPLDILPLAKHFIDKHTQRMGLTSPPNLQPCAEHKLLAHAWPGNVRELENVMQRALILATGEEVTEKELLIEDFLPSSINQATEQAVNTSASSAVTSTANSEIPANTASQPPLNSDDLREDLWEKEKAMILAALEEEGGRKNRTAERLAISPRTLRYKLARMREEGLDV